MNYQRVLFWMEFSIMVISSVITSICCYLEILPMILFMANVGITTAIFIAIRLNKESQYKIFGDFKQKQHWRWCWITMGVIVIISLFIEQELRNSILCGIAPEMLLSFIAAKIAKKWKNLIVRYEQQTTSYRTFFIYKILI